MKFTIYNNNPKNFKFTYEVNGQPQKAQLSTVNDTYIKISPRVVVQLNPYGRIYGDGAEITHHTMTEEEFFQNSLVDPLAEQKKVAAQLLETFYSNGKEMSEELLELILAPQPIAKTKKPKKS
ncbi:hypothetical protein LWU71_07725 [Enterobacter hormaechei]|nr:hypothetical protein [Enterobacter hormaechei]MCE1369595.1 hypothetical protein [Enterobacter hormaechei]